MAAADTVSNTKAGASGYKAQPRRKGLSDRAIVKLFIWPTLILLIAWNLFPLAYSLFLSFTNYSAIVPKAPVWVGFENYKDILTDPQLWKYFATTGTVCTGFGGNETLLGFRAGHASQGEVQRQRLAHHADPDPDDAFTGGGWLVLEAHLQPIVWVL